MKIQTRLSASGLFEVVRTGFEKIIDGRAPELIKISLPDTLMSGFALFSLKDPSLLAFDERRKVDNNLQRIFGIEQVPCDTQMRTTLDEVELADVKVLGWALVHPNLKEVIPLAPEMIIKQDGADKNDCERNAAKRFFEQLRHDHPHLPVIIIEDALSSNAPHIRELEKYDCRYILGVKEGDHAFLFDWVAAAHQAGLTTDLEISGVGMTHKFRFINQVPLNQSNQYLLVNFIEYWEVRPDGKTQHFCWITDFIVTGDNVFQLMRGGRSRWKIENETFNTLKNQGYHFEHNFWHGEKNLSGVFATLMMLAFLVDQVQQVACRLF